jgi:hypothetical protein
VTSGSHQPIVQQQTVLQGLLLPWIYIAQRLQTHDNINFISNSRPF